MRILATFFSIFFSLAISFAEPNFIVNGKIVTEKEYNEAKSLQLVNGDTFSEINEENLARNWAGDISPSNLNQNEHIPSICLLYTSPSPRDGLLSRMPSSA